MEKPQSIILATRNPGKLAEMRAILGDIPVTIVGLDGYGHVPEPAETGSTFAENARDKALYYAAATAQWCLADDSGLEVDALDGEPGVLSARYAWDSCPPSSDRQTIDAANNAKLLNRLKDVDDEHRTARFVCHIALANPQRVVIETFDTFEGRIGHDQAGKNGFGYDPLFYLSELGCTSAQLDPHHKNQISHRGKAVRHFAALLKSFLTQAS